MRRSSIPVAAAAAQLDQITMLAASDIEPTTLARVRELIDVTSERSEMDPTWCVIGMLGGTGAGKSSLVNALSGGEVVRAGVLRPTTNEACAPAPGSPAQCRKRRASRSGRVASLPTQQRSLCASCQHFPCLVERRRERLDAFPFLRAIQPRGNGSDDFRQ